MSNKLIILLISMVTFVSAFGKGAETDGGVLILNEKNLLVETLNRPWLLIEFYAPWCAHCQKMEPVYSQAAKMLQLHSPMLHVGKINVDENKQLQEMYQIQKFPTFVIFKNGNFLETYNGETTARAIYNAVVKNNHAEKQVTDCKVITKMKKQANQFTFVYFGPEDHPFYKGIYLPFWEETINNKNNNHLQRVHIRHSDDEFCATEMMVKFPSIMMYKDFETPEKLQMYSGDEEPTLESFQNWRFHHMAPTPSPLMKHSDVTMGSGMPVIILFRSDASKDDDFVSEFTEAALELNGQAQIYFTETNLDDEYPEKLAKHFNFDRQDMPQIRIHGGGMKFKPYHFTTRNATSALIIDFIRDVFEGRTKHYQRVQRAPKYNDGAIKILTTDTLSEFASTPDTANIVIYWKPRKDRIEGAFRPALWEAVEEYRDRGLLGPGKIIFGEFNEEENEIDGEPISVMDMVFINKQIDGEQRETLTFSQNELSPLIPGKNRVSASVSKDAFVAWFEHVYFSKLPGAVPKAEESKKTEDEIKSEL